MCEYMQKQLNYYCHQNLNQHKCSEIANHMKALECNLYGMNIKKEEDSFTWIFLHFLIN